jgi:hypothetical protein
MILSKEQATDNLLPVSVVTNSTPAENIRDSPGRESTVSGPDPSGSDSLMNGGAR